MSTESPVLSPRSVADFWTVVAITAIVHALGSLLHEGLGHGGACLAIGAHPVSLTSVYFDCSRDSRWVSAAGTLANFAAGIVCWLLLHGSRASSPRLRYFLWLLMTLNLLDGAGYFLFSGVGNIGDWADVIRGLQPAWAWHAGLAVLGAGLYFLLVCVAARELLRFLPAGEDRWRTARRLTWLPYVAGGIISCIAGAFNPQGMILVAISAAAASFGGASGLIWMSWFMASAPRWFPPSPEPLRPLTRSRSWIVAGCVVAALFIFGLGRGVMFH